MYKKQNFYVLKTIMYRLLFLYRKSGETLQRHGVPDNPQRSTTPRGHLNRLGGDDDEESSPRGYGSVHTSPSGPQGRYFHDDAGGEVKGFYSQRNKRNRPGPVRQLARDEETSSAYSTYGIPKQSMRIRQPSSGKASRLLEEQRRLEQELEELMDRRKTTSPLDYDLHSTDDHFVPQAQNTNSRQLKTGSSRYQGTSHPPSRAGLRSDDVVDVEVASLLRSERVPAQPNGILGNYRDGRTILPGEYSMAKDEGYEELSVDYPSDYSRYPLDNRTDRPIRILLSASSPEYDSIFSRLKTSESVLSYYEELRAQETRLKEQIRFYRRTLEQNLDLGSRQDIEQKYFESQRELNVMEKELVKLFTFLSPDMLRLLRNSESKKGFLSGSDHVTHQSPYGIMGSHTDSLAAFDSRMSSHVPTSFDYGIMGNQNVSSHLVPFSTNQNAVHLPVNHPHYVTSNDLRATSYPGGNIYGMNEMHDMIGIHGMQSSQASNHVHFGTHHQFQENPGMNPMHNAPPMSNIGPIFQTRDMNNANNDNQGHVAIDPKKSPLSTSLEDKQTQTFGRDTGHDVSALHGKRHAEKDASVTQFENLRHRGDQSPVHSEPNDRVVLQDICHAKPDVDTIPDLRHAEISERSRENDLTVLQDTRDTEVDASVNNSKEQQNVTPKRRPVPLPRDRTPRKPNASDVTSVNLNELKKERKLPQPVPRTQVRHFKSELLVL